MPLVDTHLPHSGNNVLNQPGDVEGPVLIEKVRDVEDGQARVVETQLGQKALHDDSQLQSAGQVGSGSEVIITDDTQMR